MALSYAFDPSQGETPDTVARRRQTADMLAARIFSNTPRNVGEGLNLIGQALIARQMQNEANDAQKAGQATAMTPQQLAALSTAPSAPLDLSPASSNVVPNDSNAIPGTVGMNQTLADRTQDFIQDNPGTSMTSGVRSTADQARLYADRANNPNPVAAPGTSLHEKGLAVDIGGVNEKADGRTRARKSCALRHHLGAPHRPRDGAARGGAAPAHRSHSRARTSRRAGDGDGRPDYSRH